MTVLSDQREKVAEEVEKEILNTLNGLEEALKELRESGKCLKEAEFHLDEIDDTDVKCIRDEIEDLTKKLNAIKRNVNRNIFNLTEKMIIGIKHDRTS